MTSSLCLTASKLRKNLNSRYSIDHIIELQLLVAAVKECYPFEFENPNFDKDIDVGLDFVQYFQADWNLEIKPKDRNRRKRRSVTSYIKWKYGESTEMPSPKDLEIVEQIFRFYNEWRTDIRNDLKQISKKFLNIEEKLFNLLKNRTAVTSIDCNCHISEEVNQLIEIFSYENNLDHIVEFQMIVHVFVDQDNHNIHLARKFGSYFNWNWNLMITDRATNDRKGQHVRQWLKYIYGETESVPSPKIYSTIDFIADHYDQHRAMVCFYIKNDPELTEEHVELFLELESKLSDLLFD